jgi:hypothetical protein
MNEIKTYCKALTNPCCVGKHDIVTEKLYTALSCDGGPPALVRLCQDQFDHYRAYGWFELKPFINKLLCSKCSVFFPELQSNSSLLCHNCTTN